jgi:hypothetical protein
MEKKLKHIFKCHDKKGNRNQIENYRPSQTCVVDPKFLKN